MIRFSIVIAVYNKERYLGRTLQSVLDQTFTNFEVIIINDGSTDGSVQEIKKFTDPRIFCHTQTNAGAAAARNAGIGKAKAPYIALLDADDYWHSGYLSEIDKLIATYPYYKIFATAVSIETRGKIISPTYSLPDLKPNEIRIVDFFKASCIHSILTSSSTVLNKEVFHKAGFYDTELRAGEDTDLWVRLGLHYPIVFLNKICAIYHYNENSLSKTVVNLTEKASFHQYENFEKQRPEVKKFLDLNRFSLAILAKLNRDKEAFKKNYEAIDLNNLNRKQRFLIQAPASLLSKLKKIKGYFERKGIYLSTFK